MPDPKPPASVVAASVPARVKKTNYPEPFAARMAKREKRVLGDLFGLKNFGVNLTRLAPGGESSLLHRHGRQDEFIYVVDGTATLVTDTGEVPLSAGMCVGFAAGAAAHHIVNRGEHDVVFLEVGDRLPGDTVIYPADDIQAVMGSDGTWRFAHKDGTPY